VKALNTLHGTGGCLFACAPAVTGRVAALGAAAGVAVAYYLAARLGLALLSAPSDVAVFWPASGLAAGILILSNRRRWPAIAIGIVAGTVAANLISDRNIWISLLKGFCNAGEALLVAALIERWFGRPFAFGDLRRVLGFAAATCLGAAASALGGAATMTLFHSAAPYWDVWRAWFLSDGVGILMVAPLVIGFGQAWNKSPSRAESIEAAGVLSLLALIIWGAVTDPTGSWLSFDPDAVVLPLLLWLVARCEPAFGIAGAFIVSLTVIWATTFGIGHFGDAAVPIGERVSGAQVVIVMVTLYTLVLAALFAQRSESEAQLAKKSAALARLHEISTRLWLKHDLRQAIDEILAGAIELLGADMGSIRMWDGARGTLRVEAHRGFKGENFDLQLSAGESACERALRSGERIVIEDVEVDGSFAPFRQLARAAGYRAIQATPILSRKGAPLGILASHCRSPHKLAQQNLHLLDVYVRQAADIIEHHKAVSALRTSEERLRLAQLKTGIGLWDWDLRTGEVTWTPELEAIYGLEPGTVKCYGDFRDRVDPDDIERVEAERAAAIRHRDQFNLEFRIIRSDGEVRWILAMGGAFYDEATGMPTRVLGNNLDITERKAAEQALTDRNAQLALAGRAALVGSYAYDVNKGTMQVSEGYAAIHGLPEGTTETSYCEWRARVHHEDLEWAEGSRERAFANGRQEDAAEYRIVLPTGEARWIERRGSISYDEEGRPERVVGVNIDVSERKRADERQRVLVAELDHRVKNALATVSSVVSQTAVGNGSVVNFVAALDGRIRSMATTHELLSAGRWHGISLTELIQRELAPYATSSNVDINGPEIVLHADAGQAMAMVLHELATNAAKYGALSTGNGRVSIRWDQRPNGHSRSHLVFEWQEIGGPPVEAPGNPSYGTTTIRDLIPYEFGGTVDLVLASDGVRCRLELPADWLSNDREPVSETNAHISLRTGAART
jgi:PAS domain S-box-containing protein